MWVWREQGAEKLLGEAVKAAGADAEWKAAIDAALAELVCLK